MILSIHWTAKGRRNQSVCKEYGSAEKEVVMQHGCKAVHIQVDDVIKVMNYPSMYLLKCIFMQFVLQLQW